MNNSTLTWTRRILGFLLTLFSAASLVISGYALVKTWQAQAELSARLLDASANVQATLKSTAGSLETTSKTISATINTLAALRPTLLSVANGAHDVQPALDELQTITGESLPGVITATQTSLRTAQQSAAAIESLLRLLSQIPFFPSGPYNPPVSLEESLGYVADDLEGLRVPLDNLQSAASDAGASLDGLDNQIIKLILLLDQIRYSLQDTNRMVDDSRQDLLAAQARLGELDDQIPVAMRSAAMLLSFILAWIGLLQLSWVVKGMGWVMGS